MSEELINWERILSSCQQISACLNSDRLRQQVAKVVFNLCDCEAVLWVSGGLNHPRLSAVYPASRKEARSIADPREFLRYESKKIRMDRLSPPVTIAPFTVESIIVCQIDDSSQNFLVIINPSTEISVSDIEKIFPILEKQVHLQNNLIRHLEAAQKMALIDDLTGLYNARYFQESLEREWKRGERYKTSFSLLFVDIDDFKNVNDMYGHLTGSAILQEVADILKVGIRNVDSVFRYGGDEFTVILPNCSESDAKIVKERLQLMINRHKFSSPDGKPFYLTASIGVSSYPNDGDKIQQLIESADRSMYQEKTTEASIT